MEFRRYNGDYDALCDFLIELNQKSRNHINWNWARFEWMYAHPEFDRNLLSSIGLWDDGKKIVGAAIYDMYFGEAFCGVLPEYDNLYPEVLEYAYHELKDDSGLGISICDEDHAKIKVAENCGFVLSGQSEQIRKFNLLENFSAPLPNGFSFRDLDPSKEPYEFQWLLWQGFNHGEDKEEFEKTEKIIPQIRRHFNSHLSVAAINTAGENVSYCCLWYNGKTDYAYVEPVCTVPAYRGKGISKAVIFEALNRAKLLGAKDAVVISDMAFYEKLCFQKDLHFSFWWKK
ncbi:MAG: GNAT family N-acetyltransferase [Treponema sp.]|nr:GNAT family N-acetyltransferase [Treponema sp.]